MTDSTPSRPGSPGHSENDTDHGADAAVLSIQQQLDALLAKVEQNHTQTSPKPAAPRRAEPKPEAQARFEPPRERKPVQPPPVEPTSAAPAPPPPSQTPAPAPSQEAEPAKAEAQVQAESVASDPAAEALARDLAAITAALEAEDLITPSKPQLPQIAPAEAQPAEATPPQAAAPAPPPAVSESEPEPDSSAMPVIDQQIDEMLAKMDEPAAAVEAEPVEPEAVEPEPVEQAAAAAASPAPASQPASTPVEAEQVRQMTLEEEIAALLADHPVDPEVEQAAASIAERDAEQAEIEAAMFQRPAAKGSPAAPGADADAAEASAEELIAEEIQGLLDSAAEDESTAPDEVADDAGASDPSIDEIDRMLADEAEQDEELIGDFQSVQDVAAGVKPEGPGQRLSDHGPSERDGSASAVADELDNQPEHAEPDTFEPNPEAEGAAAPGWFDRMRGMPWRGVGEKVEKVALAACGVMNWPVRRLLAPEWRSYVGVIALLNVFVGIAAFVVGLVRFVL